MSETRPAIALAARANAVLSLFGLLVSAVTSVALVRLLPPAAYADLATIMAIVALAATLAEAGMNVGYARQLREAEKTASRRTLYLWVLRRRLLFLPVLGAAMAVGGGAWVKFSGLDDALWTPAVFVIVAATVVMMLSGHLGYYTLIGSFRHAEALLVGQWSALAKTLLVFVAALLYVSPLAIASALLVAAALSAAWFHWRAASLVRGERAPISDDLIRPVRRHGLVSALDKLAAFVGSVPFLLIVLAAAFTRAELALLAVAGDFLQKVLGVSSAPVSNMVMPYVNHWRGTGQYAEAVRKIGVLTALIFVPTVGAIAVAIPFGIAALYGAAYAFSALIILIMAVPMFFETWVRMVPGFALISEGVYRPAIYLNLAKAAVALATLYATMRFGLLAVVAAQAAIQLCFSLVLLRVTAAHDILASRVLPPGLLLTTTCAVGLALLAQFLMPSDWTHARPLIGLCVFALGQVGLSRFLLRIDAQDLSTIERMVGSRMARLLPLRAMP